jgi:geranylgeranyl reductase family protein
MSNDQYPRTVLDLLIIGAGPAGAAAAIDAARRGLDAVTIDKATFPRDKCCGDGLTTGCLRQLDALGLDPSTVPSWQTVSDVHVAGPNRVFHTFPLPRDRGTFAAITRRSELDAALVARAREVGADVREGVAVESIAILDDGTARVGTTAGHFDSRHVIAADGMYSPTRKMLGLQLPSYRGDWHAFRQYFTNVTPRAQTDLFVWFEEDLLPGYVWCFPLADGSANVGFGIQRDTGHRVQDMNRLWPDILARPHIRAVIGDDAVPEGPHRAWPIPARIGDVSLGSGPVLFVGDAAAATDPMTGEGIGQAIETGRDAVTAIVKHPDDPLSAYEATLRSGMVKDHGLAGALSKVLGTRRGAQWSVSVAGATGWTRRNFARWLFEDYPRAILGTPKRWHRRMFRQDGAYRNRSA